MTVLDTPGLCGLEIWRGIADGVPLSQFRGRTSNYFEHLRAYLLRLHEGTVTADDAKETTNLQQAKGFERLVFCGGGALDVALPTFLRAEALPFAVEIDAGGPYAARRGALHIFESKGWRHGVALDLGQLQLKVITATRNAIMPRDMSRLPFGAHAIDSSLGRARLRNLLEGGLSRIAGSDEAKGEAPDGIVLALPVAIGSDGVAEPATYPGLFGPVQPIFSGLFACPCVVLNDAILAGLGFPPRAREKTLIVTLGFGIGAALWLH